MSTGAPEIPPPPDPYAQAKTQMGFNREAAMVQGGMNRVGQVAVWSVTYDYAPGTGPYQEPPAFKDWLLTHPGVEEVTRQNLRQGASPEQIEIGPRPW